MDNSKSEDNEKILKQAEPEVEFENDEAKNEGEEEEEASEESEIEEGEEEEDKADEKEEDKVDEDEKEKVYEETKEKRSEENESEKSEEESEKGEEEEAEKDEEEETEEEKEVLPILEIVSVPKKSKDFHPKPLMKNLDIDPYDEDESELCFLLSKPTCFIILGKPGTGKTTLAKKLAQEWRCELINSSEVLEELIQQQNDRGNILLEQLTRGEAIPEHVVIQAIENKINSPEVAHHGYILDDFPTISESYLTVTEQLELIKNLKLKPDFIINLKIPDADLTQRRQDQRIDPCTNIIYQKDVFNPDVLPNPSKEIIEEEEEEEEEQEGIEDEEDEKKAGFQLEILERLVQRPEDFESRVEENITKYKTNLLRLLEDYMEDHDQQYVIELDANEKIPNIFKQLMMKLDCFVLCSAIKVTPLRDADEEEAPEELDTEELMKTFAIKQPVSSRFRWKRSRWLQYCPVALYEGNIIQGKPEFGVGFLDKMYFLSSEEAMEKFMKNPRPYLLPPQPRNPCKVCVIGLPNSGKTSLCKLLAKTYDAQVLTRDQVITFKKAKEKKRILQKARDDTTEVALNVVKERVKERLAIEEAERRKSKAEQKAAIEVVQAVMEEVEQEEKEDEERMTTAKEVIKTVFSAAKKEIKGADDTTEDESTVEDKESVEEGEKGKAGDTEVDAEKREKSGDSKDDTTEDINTAEDKESVEEGEKGKAGDTEVDAEKREKSGDSKDDTTEDINTAEDKESVEEGEKGKAGDTEVDAEKREKSGDSKETTESDSENLEDEEEKDKGKEIILKDDEDKLSEEEGDEEEDEDEETTREKDEDIQSEEEDDGKEEVQKVEDEESEERPLSPFIEVTDPEVVEIIDAAEKEAESQPIILNAENLIDGMQEIIVEKEKEMQDADKDGPKQQEREETVEEEEREQQERQETDTANNKDQQNGFDEDEQIKEIDLIEKISSTILPTLQEEVSEKEWLHQEEDIALETAKEENAVLVLHALDAIDRNSNNRAKMFILMNNPEVIMHKEKLMEADRNLSYILGTVTGSTSFEPTIIDVNEKNIDMVLEETIQKLESRFKYQPLEYTTADMEEEDEYNAADEDDDEIEEEEDEEEEPTRSKRKAMGDVKFSCPVALQEMGILYPGKADLAAKYRDKIYYFSTEEALEKFFADPLLYLPNKKPYRPPVLKLFILGPRGAGKTLFGRCLARKHKVFHISFREHLQEIIFRKTNRKIEPDMEVEEEQQEEESEDEDEAGAITSPDGTQFKEQSKAEGRDETNKAALRGREPNANIFEPHKDKNLKETELELTEDEAAIKANLENDDEPLGSELLGSIIMDWWNKEPFRSTGFILEGFPRTDAEMTYLIDERLLPDAVIILNLEINDVINRLLQPKLEKWKAKREKKLAKRKKKKELAKAKRNAAIKKRREELEKEAAEKRAEEEAKLEEKEEKERVEEQDLEEEEEINIEELLAEEFPEEEEEDVEEEETEEDAKDRMTTEITDVFENDMAKVDAIQEILDEHLIPILQIESARKQHIVCYLLNKALKPYVEYRESFFERVYPINEDMAQKLLHSGYKQISRFGHWCPIKLFEGDCIQPMSGTGYERFPCIYRQHIYFLSSLEASEEFVNNPLRYLKQPCPKSVVPIKIAVIGPPKSGKTTLSERFAEEYGILRLSIGEAMRSILANQPKTYLAKEIMQYLCQGYVVPDKLAVQALEIALLNVRCKTRGFVLDGFPVKKKQAEMMSAKGIIPIQVFELGVKEEEVLERGARDQIAVKPYVKHDSSSILALKMTVSKHEMVGLREFYQQQHRNHYLIDGERSQWWVWNEVRELAKLGIRHIQNYLERISEGKAASIARMCVTSKEFLKRVSDFGQYCPVTLATSGELVDCETNPYLEFAAEYKGHYYKMAGQKELELFLKEPEKYIPPLAPRQLPPPELLPKRLLFEQLPPHVHFVLRGYCPVTYLDGKFKYEYLIEGKTELVAEYKKKFYIFESEEKLQKFLRLPEKYCNLILPHKLPPKLIPIDVLSLPNLGFMEQCLAIPLTNALTAVGTFKPKYPFLNPKNSALLYVAYHLKAFNPKNSDYIRKKYRQKLKKFEETCQLVSYLSNNMTINYKEPEKRPEGFDVKLQTFFALKNCQPNATWIS